MPAGLASLQRIQFTQAYVLFNLHTEHYCWHVWMARKWFYARATARPSSKYFIWTFNCFATCEQRVEKVHIHNTGLAFRENKRVQVFSLTGVYVLRI